MAELVRVSVFFDAQGTLSLRRGADQLDHLAARVGHLAQAQNTLGRAASLVADDMNRYAQQMYRTWHPVVGGINRLFTDLGSTMGRLVRVGFYSMIGGFAAMTYGATKLFREFVKINEQFKGLEITLQSAFKSVLVAKQLREELIKITATSPIPFEDLAQLTVATSLLPQLGGKIAEQALRPSGTKGSLSDPDGFFRKMTLLVEQMLTFRPDKQVKDVIFAVREAATGELRSLIRRFDFPPSLLVQASGKSVQELKKDPVAMVEAIEKSFNRIISMEAVRKIALQPKHLFANIIEQMRTIPLLAIGESGFYDTFVGFFGKFYERLTDFTTNFFKSQFAPRFSKTMTDTFLAVTGAVDKAANLLLSKIGSGFDSRSRPTEGIFERVTGATLHLVESAGAALPGFIARAQEFIAIVIPAFLKAAKMLSDFLTFIADAFNKHPLLTAAGGLVGLSLIQALPNLLSGMVGKVVDRAMKVAQNVRAATQAGSFSTASNSVGAIAALRAGVPGLPPLPAVSRFTRTMRALVGGVPSTPVTQAAMANLTTMAAQLAQIQAPSYAAQQAMSAQVARNAQALAGAGGVLQPGGGYRFPAGSAVGGVPIRTGTTLSPVGTGSQNAAIAAGLAGQGFIPIPTAQRAAAVAAAAAVTPATQAQNAALAANFQRQSAILERQAAAAAARTSMREAAISGSAGFFSSRIGTAAGSAAMGIGIGQTAAASIAGGTAAISSLVAPIAIALVATGIIYFIVDKVKAYVAREQTKETEKIRAATGLTLKSERDRLGVTEKETTTFAQDLRTYLKRTGTPDTPIAKSAADFPLTPILDPMKKYTDAEKQYLQEVLDLTRERARFFPKMNELRITQKMTGVTVVDDPSRPGSGAKVRLPGEQAVSRDIGDVRPFLQENFKGEIVEAVNLTEQNVADRMANIATDIAALNEIIEQKGGLALQETKYLMKSQNFALKTDASGKALAGKVLGALLQVQKDNAEGDAAFVASIAVKYNIPYDKILTPDQAVSVERFRDLEKAFSTGHETLQNFYANYLTTKTLGKNTVAVIMTKLAALDLPTVPVSITEMVESETARLKQEFSKGDRWTPIIKNEGVRMDAILGLRKEIEGIAESGAGDDVLKQRDDFIAKIVADKKSGVFKDLISDEAFQITIDNATKVKTIAQLKEVLQAFAANLLTKGMVPIMEALNIEMGSALTGLVKATTESDRGGITESLFFNLENQADIMSRAFKKDDPRLADFLLEFDTFKRGYEDQLKVPDELFDLDDPQRETYVRRKTRDVVESLTKKWVEFIQRFESTLSPSDAAGMEGVVDNTKVFFKQSQEELKKQDDMARRKQYEERQAVTKSAFKELIGGNFEVHNIEDVERVRGVLKDADEYLGRFNERLPASLLGVVELSTAGINGFTNNLLKLDKINEGLDGMVVRLKASAAAFEAVGMVEKAASLRLLISEMEKAQSARVDKRFGATESFRGKYFEDFRAAMDADFPKVKTPEADELIKQRLEGFDKVAHVQNLPSMTPFLEEFVKPRDTLVQAMDFYNTRLKALRMLREEAIRSRDALDEAGLTTQAEEQDILARKALESIVKTQEDIADLGTKRSKRATDSIEEWFGMPPIKNIHQYRDAVIEFKLALEGMEAEGIVEPLAFKESLQYDRYAGGQVGRMRALEASSVDIADQMRAKAEYAKSKGDLIGENIWQTEEQRFLKFAGTYKEGVDEIVGLNGSMVDSFTDGFRGVTEQWEQAATNFTDIGRGMATGVADSLSSSLMDIATNAKSAGEAMSDFGLSVLHMATQMLTQKAIQSVFGILFGSILGGPAGAISGAVVGQAAGGSIGAGGGFGISPLYDASMQVNTGSGRGFSRGDIGSPDSRALSSLGGSGSVLSGISGAVAGMRESSPKVAVNIVMNSNGEIEKANSKTEQDAERLGRAMQVAAERVVQEHTRQGGIFRRRQQFKR